MVHQESLKSRNTSTRISPSSSSFSISNKGATPTLSGSGTCGSSLLQERLRERNADRRKSIPFGDDGTPCSPTRSRTARDERRPSSSGLSAKGMGVKQWEEQASSLHKQNYNLKLELFHRRDRQSKLEAELATARKIIKEQSECQEINDMLLAELDRRDQAVDEAINLITSLEEQIEFLREENQRLCQDRNNDNEYAADSIQSFSHYHNERCGSPLSNRQISLPRPLPKVPSFLSDQSEGTEALRSLYAKNTRPSVSNLSKLEEDEGDESLRDPIDSPRLSVLSRLSESSFVSVYGDKNAQDTASQESTTEISPAVLNWVEKAPKTGKLVPLTPPLQKTQFTSLDNVVNSSPRRRSESLSAHTTKDIIVNTQAHRNPSSNFNRFELRQALPPTPDTFCTSKLQVERNSVETLNQKYSEFSSSISNNSRVSLPARPQSACETVTSRRDGHDWDTSSVTEEGSIESTNDSSFTHFQPRHIEIPTLFTFSESDWDRNDTYSHKPYQLSRVSLDSIDNKIHRNSIPGQCRNCQCSYINSEQTDQLDSNKQNNAATSRSSEATAGKHERTLSVPVISTANSLSPVWKRNPISLTLARFRRNDSLPNCQSSLTRPKLNTKAQNSITDRKIISRDATPPPILRHRNLTPTFRPASASNALMFQSNGSKDVIQEQRDERYRRVSSCAGSSLPQREVQFVEADREEETTGGKGMRKWLGLGAGRSNSIKKN
ncbi:putative serine threonine protein kinase domain protein [Golovinomyces cichoracearum]|uniref:Putative serine threonine protein kinase domain protein n=1 Tax=Golovinomyces cichoracearum TaxID=62708 RepID=A0A420HUR2_9PEZI|nr:putative serine threonine protein kinase domain protein [Golovinomyces cichoracearum]